ncbi:tetratricopeptide repeat protein, partial [Akkermansiaceae bacterium]|nr:tetratricopeptide repeat protein [Akkermansiaceae bacterium]
EWNEDALRALDIRKIGQTLIRLLRESIAEDLTSSGITPEEVELAIEQFSALAVRADTADVARNLLYEEIITTLNRNLKSKFSKDPLTQSNLRGGLADTCLNLGMLEAAYQLNLSRYEALSALPKDNGMRFVATSDLAAVLSFKGKYTEAEIFYLEALEGVRISNKTQGEDNFIFTGGLLNSLGENSYFLGKPDEAETYYLEGLEADPENYRALQNMGNLRLNQDRQSEAENFYIEALKVCRRVEGNESPARFDIISALGSLFRNQGKFDEAERHHQELFEYHRQRFGKGHVNTINYLQEIGRLRDAEGKMDQAELIYRDCLERRFNSDTPLIFETFKNLYYLANNLHKQGKHDSAQKFDQQLLEMSERLDIPNHGGLSTDALIKIGSKQTDPKRAEIFFEKAIMLARSYYGEKHKNTSDAIFGLGKALIEQGKYREAEECFEEALKIRRRVFGKEHAGTAIAVGYLGGVSEKLGKIDKAERCYREYLEINRGLYGDEHFQTLVGLRNLGELLKNHGKSEEAEVFLQEIITLVARRPEHVAELWPDLVKNLAPLENLKEKLDVFGDHFGNRNSQKDSGDADPFSGDADPFSGDADPFKPE